MPCTPDRYTLAHTVTGSTGSCVVGVEYFQERGWAGCQEVERYRAQLLSSCSSGPG